MKKALVILYTMFIFLSVAGVVDATLLTFDDPSNLGVTLDGNMLWSDIGGGHIYCEQYFDNDSLLSFPDSTYINSFQITGIPWEGHWSQDWEYIDFIDIAAFDVNDNEVWRETVDLRGYKDWSKWLTVSVETGNISTMIFYATAFTGGVFERPGFWPSIDNMRINENHPIPEPSVMLLLSSGLIGLAVLGRKKLFKQESDRSRTHSALWRFKYG